ncbi:hypothetical protein BFJ69_g8778 [Fusarium oxysporum]|uniref:Uncharacterized protein n=1 Tax=Fusarium oxysporum TaxID=5507 RepID=A0A420N195_FUSOX|nr:hypothetical protein BFJ69_g8778 [Fusarium oxysporum]
MMVLTITALETGHVAKKQHAPSLLMVTTKPLDSLDQVKRLQGHGFHQRQESESDLIDLTVAFACDETYALNSFDVRRCDMGRVDVLSSHHEIANAG